MSATEEPISLSSVVVADDRQVSVEMGEETLVLHMETGGYYSLRKVAAVIWEQLKSPVAAGTIAENLHERYGIPRERCEADLLELLTDLRERDLVRIVRDPRPEPPEGGGNRAV
jgi:hypothetical protein